MPSPNAGGPLSVVRVLDVRGINIKAAACNLHCGMIWFPTWSRKCRPGFAWLLKWFHLQLPCDLKDSGVPNSSSSTPWKINMEPTNHPFRRQNDLNQTSMIMSPMLIFRGVGSENTMGKSLATQIARSLPQYHRVKFVLWTVAPLRNNLSAKPKDVCWWAHQLSSQI